MEWVKKGVGSRKKGVESWKWEAENLNKKARKS